MNLVLIDTSAWTHAVRPNGDVSVKHRVQVLLENEQAAWCDIIRIELWRGLRGRREYEQMKLFDERLPRLSIDTAVWDLACELGYKAKSTGLIVPVPDLVIFACSRVHQVELEHADKHYPMLETVFSA